MGEGLNFGNAGSRDSEEGAALGRQAVSLEAAVGFFGDGVFDQASFKGGQEIKKPEVFPSTQP